MAFFIIDHDKHNSPLHCGGFNVEEKNLIYYHRYFCFIFKKTAFGVSSFCLFYIFSFHHQTAFIPRVFKSKYLT